MVFRVVYGMRGSLDRHVLCIAHFPLPSAGKLFIPVHRTGYSSFKNFINRNHSKSMGLYVVRCEIPWIMKSAHCVPQNRRFFIAVAPASGALHWRAEHPTIYLSDHTFVIFSFE
jgi:hypothetical protein